MTPSACFDVASYRLYLSFHPEKYKLEAPASESCLFEIKLTNCRQRARNSLACAAGLYEQRNIKKRMLHAIMGKPISYSQGREVTRADREHVDSVFESIAQENYSLRAAIHAIVAHPAFVLK